MSNISKLARNGSHTSVASSSSSIDTSSHNHVLNSIRASPSLRTWLQESLVDHRHERIAAGLPAMSMGFAIVTREMMGMHMQQPPEIRGILGDLPTSRAEEIGFRHRLRTWPMSKHETLRRKLGTWPLSKSEVLLATPYPVQPARPSLNNSLGMKK